MLRVYDRRFPAVDSKLWNYTRIVWSFLEEVALATEHDKILVVAHGGVLRTISYTLTHEGLGLPE